MTRPAAVVNEANAIGTTYLRAQTLAEPMRSTSMRLLKRYTDTRIALSDAVPDSKAFRSTSAEGQVLQRKLWALAGQALTLSPQASAPRLYVETLNEMIDAQSTRLASLENRIPDAVMYLQIAVSTLAFGVLGLYLSLLGRAVVPRSSARSWWPSCSRDLRPRSTPPRIHRCPCDGTDQRARFDDPTARGSPPAVPPHRSPQRSCRAVRRAQSARHPHDRDLRASSIAWR